MALGAGRAWPAADGDQWRRGRARHVQGPLLSRNRSAPLYRGHVDRRACGRSDRSLYLSPRRISGLARNPRARNRKTAAWRTNAAYAPRRRRLYLRRGILAAGKPGRQARAAPAQAAFSVPGRAVRTADLDQQYRDAVVGPRHRRKGRGVVERARAATSATACAAFQFRAG